MNLPLAFLNGVDPWIFGFSFLTVAVTLWMGFRSAKTSKTASDFFVAGRSVSVGWNASAISGEYLSAASFMGVAGMVMSSGYDALWYPVCYACGYLFLLLFIAGPLRRFGAYTIPDFAEGRFDSPLFRKIAVCFVLFIGFFYTMPQMKGAGVTLAYIFPGLPYWVGVVLVGAVITFNVALGGMKGITLVQAFQYWIKMFAISVPVFVLMAVVGFYNTQIGANLAPGETAAPVSSIERKPLVEKAPKDTAWIAPFGPLTTKAVTAAANALPAEQRPAFLAEHQKPYSLLYTYSLIIALVCGTAGLPQALHIAGPFKDWPEQPVAAPAKRSDHLGAGFAAKRVTLAEIIGDVLKGCPFHARMLGDVFDQALQHQQNLRTARHIGVDGKGEDGIIHLAVHPIELVAPHFFDVTRVDEPVRVRGLFHEHHRRQIVDIPVGCDIDEVDFLAVLQGMHPFLGGLGIIYRVPAVAHFGIEGLEITVALAVVIGEAVLEQQCGGRVRHFPPRGHIAARGFARQALDQVYRLDQNVFFLAGRHGDGVFVQIAMRAHFVTVFDDHFHFLGESLQRVAGNEERGLQIVFLEQAQQARNAHFCGEDAALDVRR